MKKKSRKHGKKTILQEAQQIIHGARKKTYGSPSVNLGRTALIWSAVLGTTVTARQVALCMIGVKLARDTYKPKRDNLVDIAGYAGCAEILEEESKPNEFNRRNSNTQVRKSAQSKRA